MKLADLVESKIRFFLDDDIIEPMPRRQGYKAHLVKGKLKEIWVPKSVVKEVDIVDQESGEIFRGYYVKEWWRNRTPNIKTIRRSKTDYKELPAKYITV